MRTIAGVCHYEALPTIWGDVATVARPAAAPGKGCTATVRRLRDVTRDTGRRWSPGPACDGLRAVYREDALTYGSAGTRLPRVRPLRTAPDQRRAIGSAGERLVHTEEVTGSIPVSPTRSEAMRASVKMAVGAIPVAKWSASLYAHAYGGPTWLGRRQHLLRSLGGVPRPGNPSALSGPVAWRCQPQARP